MLINELSRNAPFGLSSTDSSLMGERTRFQSILARHLGACGDERKKFRAVLVEYLQYSPQSRTLINDLIMDCVSLKKPDRSDVAIDVLSQLDRAIYDYAYDFFVQDVSNWSHMSMGRAYEPNDDYWYILLRSVAQSGVPDEIKLELVRGCRTAASRGVLEGVVEALGDIDSHASRACLLEFTTYSDPFIADLAKDILE